MNDSTREISPLRQRMLEDMRLHKLAPQTQASYVRSVRRLAGFLSVPTTPKPFAGSSYTAAKALIDALAKYSAKTVKGLCIRSGSILGLLEFMPEIRGQAWVRPHQR